MRAGQKVLTWKDPAVSLSRQTAQNPPQGCVSSQGFSLHANVHCGPHLERLCRYITRPALGHKRVTRTPQGDVVLELKTPYRDGTTHVIMSPLEFLQRLAALVPRPRLHLIRFHGVLAPNSALRPQIVPATAEHATVPADHPTDEPTPSAQSRLKWAQLLKRVFEIDMTACPNCGGPLTMIAVIEDPPVIQRILSHLGLPTRAPPRAPAKADPLFHPA